MVSTAMQSGIVEARSISRAAGIARLQRELSSLSLQAVEPPFAAQDIARDYMRAQLYSRNFAENWLKAANAQAGAPIGRAARAANALTIQGTRTSVSMIAASESSEAFNSGRARAATNIPAPSSEQPRRRLRGPASRQPLVVMELLRIWDARLDKRTCPVCSEADGTIVGIREPFPLGEPGSPHPRCRCTWQLLSSSEVRRAKFIEPLSSILRTS